MTEHMTPEQLFEDNIKLVYKTVNTKYNSPRFLDMHSLTKDELIQSGRIGLHKASSEYDPSEKVKFSTFAINHIKWSIQTECKREGLNTKKWSNDLLYKTSLDKVIGYSDGEEIHLYDLLRGDEETKEYEDALFEVLEEVKRKYSDRLYQIIRLRAEGYKNNEVGEIIGVSRQRIDQELKKIENDMSIRSMIVA